MLDTELAVSLPVTVKVAKLRVLCREEKRRDAFWSQMWSDLPKARRAAME